MLIPILIIIVIFYLYFTHVFFIRDPARSVPSGDYIIAPANGKIISITKISEIENLKIRKGLLGKINTMTNFLDEGYVISILMNVHNVHGNEHHKSGTSQGRRWYIRFSQQHQKQTFWKIRARSGSEAWFRFNWP